MNRQYKRLMKKQEAQQARAPRPPKASGAPATKERAKPRQFIREVGGELGKVAWPTRQEVMAYSTVVLIAVIIVTAIIFGMDYVFARAVLSLFGIDI